MLERETGVGIKEKKQSGGDILEGVRTYRKGNTPNVRKNWNLYNAGKEKPR